jgi:hypothetical protein
MCELAPEVSHAISNARTMWCIPQAGLPVAAAMAFAPVAPILKQPYIPGPLVYATASISAIVTLASASALLIAVGCRRHQLRLLVPLSSPCLENAHLEP